MSTKTIHVKLTGHPGSGKSLIMAALRDYLGLANINTREINTIGGDPIDHEFEIDLTDEDRKYLAEEINQ